LKDIRNRRLKNSKRKTGNFLLLKLSVLTVLSSRKTTAFLQSNLSKREKKSKEQEKLDKWFGMAKKEMSKDVENDLTILKLRRYLNPSSFVNREETKHLPKYFEIGKEVIDGFNRNQKKAKGSIFERMV